MTICEFGAKSSQHSLTSAQLSRAGNTPEVFAVVLGAAADLSLSLSPSQDEQQQDEVPPGFKVPVPRLNSI